MAELNIAVMKIMAEKQAIKDRQVEKLVQLVECWHL